MYGETIWVSITLIFLGIAVVIIGFKNNRTVSVNSDYAFINTIEKILGPELAKIFFIFIGLFIVIIGLLTLFNIEIGVK